MESRRVKKEEEAAHKNRGRRVIERRNRG